VSLSSTREAIVPYLPKIPHFQSSIKASWPVVCTGHGLLFRRPGLSKSLTIQARHIKIFDPLLTAKNFFLWFWRTFRLSDWQKIRNGRGSLHRRWRKIILKTKQNSFF
jgi:hypothetical protein